MSYCVHCGVKLDNNLNSCPLCNTPVLDPTHPVDQKETALFSDELGSLEVLKRKDLAILLSVVLIATAGSCGLLNLLVFTGSLWSFFIIGVCIIIWVFAIPLVIYTKLSIYASLFLDGLAVASYLYMISIATPSDSWLSMLALPIITTVTLLALILTALCRKLSKSILSIGLYLFIEIAILCIAIELLICNYLGEPLMLTWSAVTLTACSIISITLITIISKARLRNEVRRRLHF